MPPIRAASGGSRNGPAKELASSNATTAKFLGAVPKAWMNTHSHSGIRPSPGTAGHARMGDPRCSMANKPAVTQSAAQGVHQPRLHDHVPVLTEPSSRADYRTPLHRSPPNEKLKEVESVLPSPASSDDRHESICIIDAEEGAPLNTLTDGSVTDSTRALTDQYRAVEGIEKQSRASESQQRAEGHPSPIWRLNLNEHTRNARAEKRPSDQQSERRRKTTSRQGTSVSSSPATADTDTSQPALMLQQLTHILKQSSLARAPPTQVNKATSTRLRLPRDALKAADYVYLVLHQIYCFYSRSPNSVFESYHGFAERHVNGLTHLSLILVDNSELDAIAVDWFSKFLFPVDLMFRNHAAFQIAYSKVLEFLERFHERWARVKDESRKRTCPPSANEMVIVLGLGSTILQSVLYRATYRDMWRGNVCQCTQEIEMIFSRSQQDAYRDGTPKLELLDVENQNFIIQFRRLWLHHISRCLSSGAAARIATGQRQHQSAPQPSALSRQIDSRMARPDLNIDARVAQTLSSTSRSTYTPTLPSSSTQMSPASRTNPVASIQVDLSRAAYPSNNVGSPRPDQSTGAAPALPTFHRPLSRTSQSPAGNLQSPPAQAAHTGVPPNPAFPRNSMASLPAGQQNAVSVQGPPAGLQSTFPRFMSRGQFDQLLQSYGTVSSQFGHSQRLLNTSASLSAQAPAPRPVSDRSSAAAVYSNPLTPYQPRGPASLPQSASILLRSVDQVPRPTTSMSALRQAHLRSPILEASVPGDQPLSGTKYYTYIREVRTAPESLHAKKRHLRWTWDETKEGYDSLATCSQINDGSPGRMRMQIDSRLVRLRCIKSNEVQNENDWVTADNTWPENMAIMMNCSSLDAKRKLHHGKDLALNITTRIKQGENELRIGIMKLPDDDNTTYTFGLESIHLTNPATAKSEVKTLSMEEARDRILKRAGLADPDVQVLNPSITLELTDPYSSSLCQTPVRGSSCRHNSYFDLDIFLSTRSGKTPAEPCGPDQFRCPICGADARPKSLVIDGFFVAIRQELEKLKRLDVRAVVLDEMGKWTIKEVESTGETGDGSGTRTSNPLDSRAGLNPKTNEVIELDN